MNARPEAACRPPLHRRAAWHRPHPAPCRRRGGGLTPERSNALKAEPKAVAMKRSVKDAGLIMRKWTNGVASEELSAFPPPPRAGERREGKGCGLTARPAEHSVKAAV